MPVNLCITGLRSAWARRGFAVAACVMVVTAGCGAQPQRPAPGQGRGPSAWFEPTAASFVSAGQGWVLGSTDCPDCAGLRLTRDGGARWTALPAPPAPLGYGSGGATAVSDLAFADASNGFLFGPGLLATHDGGRSWARQPLPPVLALGIGTGYAFALTQAQAGGPAELWRTAIGASGWTRLALPPGTMPPPGANYGTLRLFVEAGTVVLLQPGFNGPGVTPGQTGRLWVSLDRATTWHVRQVPCTTGEGGAATVGIAPGRPDSWVLDCFDNDQSSQEQDTSHRLYGTADAGLSWARLSVPTRRGAPVLLASNGSGHTFLATEGGSDALVGTVDGGRQWRTFWSSSFSGWADLRFLNAGTGFVIGPARSSPGCLYRTDDGGRTWRIVHL
jgi:hypothetical protein